MDFLFDNPLTNLYRPYFLVLYIPSIISTIVAYRVLRTRLDKTAYYAIPPIPVNPDPFEIAYLRGGANELARAIVFSLVKISFFVFAILSLVFVVLNESLKEKKAKACPIPANQLTEPRNTGKLLEDKPFEPAASVVENSTELLYAKNKTRKLQ